MKKITNLQLLMLMSLTLGSSYASADNNTINAQQLIGQMNPAFFMPSKLEFKQLAESLSERLQISAEDAQEMIADAFNVLAMTDAQTLMNYKRIIMEQSPVALAQITEQLANKLNITEQDASDMLNRAVYILSNAFQGFKSRAAALAARNIPGVQAQVAQRLAAKFNITEQAANNFINKSLASDAMNDAQLQADEDVVVQWRRNEEEEPVEEYTEYTYVE